MNELDNMNDEEIAAFLVNKLDEIMRFLTRSFARELSRDELSPTQYSALNLLSDNGKIPMGHLADSLNVTAPAITTMIDKLEQDMYVERFRDHDDRRIVKVGITEKGFGAITRLRETKLKLLSYLLAMLSDEEKKSWVHLHKKIGSLLEDRAEKQRKE